MIWLQKCSTHEWIRSYFLLSIVGVVIADKNFFSLAFSSNRPTICPRLSIVHAMLSSPLMRLWIYIYIQFEFADNASRLLFFSFRDPFSATKLLLNIIAQVSHKNQWRSIFFLILSHAKDIDICSKMDIMNDDLRFIILYMKNKKKTIKYVML